MGNGKWEMGNGKWEMENGKWKMENGKWEMENGKWKMENGILHSDVKGRRKGFKKWIVYSLAFFSAFLFNMPATVYANKVPAIIATIRCFTM